MAVAATTVLLGVFGAVTNAGLGFIAITAAAAAGPECGSPVVEGTTATVTCSYTGAAQQWTVPAGVTSATFDVFGAQGDGFPVDGADGGLGGRAVASLAVTPGEVLEVYVGGRSGFEQGSNGQDLPTGGFNGGGDPGSFCTHTSSGSVCTRAGFGGGGASDVRRTPHGLGERLIVAGGGGGRGSFDSEPGSGGGLVGGSAVLAGADVNRQPGSGGNQDGTSGSGSFGSGSQGSTVLTSITEGFPGGGGGGGYYGGEGGIGASGGGGSGFTPDGTGMTNGVRAGTGLVIITYTIPSAGSGQPQEPLAITPTSGSHHVIFLLFTTGGSGTGALSWVATDGTATGCQVLPGPDRLSSEIAGTCIVTVTKAGDANYLPTSSPPTVITALKLSQNPLSITSTTGTFGTPRTLTTGGGTGLGAVTFTATDGTATGCEISPAAPYTLSSASAGTCIVTAEKEGDAFHEPVSSEPKAITLFPAEQDDIAVTSTSGTFGTPLLLTTSGGSGTGDVTFIVAENSLGCEISPSAPFTLSSGSAGTCAVRATKAGDNDYLAKNSPFAFVTIAQATQAELVVTSASGTFGTPLPLTTSGGSGTGAVTYAVTDGSASDCTISPAAPFTLSTTSAGTCTVTATKAGDTNFLAASSDPTTVPIAKAPQAPLVVTSTTGTFGSPLLLSTFGGSGTGAVTFAVDDGSATGCQVSPSAPFTLSSATPGTCDVTATKAGDDNLLPRSSAPTPVALFGVQTQADLTVTSTNGTVGTPLPLTTSGGSGSGAVTFAVADGTAAGCTLSPSTPFTLSSITGGTCIVTATKTGDATFLPISSDPTPVTIDKLAQDALVLTSTEGALLEPVTMTTSGGSGTGALTYTVANGTAVGCKLIGFPEQLIAFGGGTCVVTATKGDDAVYLARSSVPTVVTIAKRQQAPLEVTSTSGPFGTPLLLTSTGGNGIGAVTYAVADGSASGCAVSLTAPFSLSSTSAGTCVVTATNAGDEFYDPASSVPTTVSLAPKLAQAIGFTSTAPGDAGVGGPSYTVTATGGGSGLPVTFSLHPTSTGCALVGSTVTFPSAGTCEIDADQAGDDDYAAAPTMRLSFPVAKGVQSIAFTSSAPTEARVGGPAVTLAVTGGPSGGSVTYTLDPSSTGCALDGNTVTFPAAGTCVINADQAGDSNFEPANRVQHVITIAPAEPPSPPPTPEPPCTATATCPPANPPAGGPAGGVLGSGAAPAPAQRPQATPSQLPATGPAPSPALLMGLLLVAVGVLLVRRAASSTGSSTTAAD